MLLLSVAPMGSRTKSKGCAVVQGGGLFIEGGIVTLDLCQIYDNRANGVSCYFALRPAGTPDAHLMSAFFVRRM